MACRKRPSEAAGLIHPSIDESRDRSGGYRVNAKDRLRKNDSVLSSHWIERSIKEEARGLRGVQSGE